tara:strand:+ start:3549 stop:4028 length:480 start_codon:yes stop_codon:yes gene_type:complete
MSQQKSASTRDPDLVRYLKRCTNRDERHGNWRQVYLDCLGMCQFSVGENVNCGELEGLEFHELFGETKGGEIKFQQRTLLCNYHHYSVHGNKWVNPRRYPSMLQVDVAIEHYLCGGLVNWIAKYNLIEREVVYDIQTDSQADKADLDNSENSQGDRGQL